MENPRITITIVTGGNDGIELKDCYFRESDSANKFNLFQPDNSPIPTIPPLVSSGEDFTFERVGDDGITDWTITKFTISQVTLSAGGNWSAHLRHEGDPLPGDPETGTFQAPGGVGEELKANASAVA